MAIPSATYAVAALALLLLGCAVYAAWRYRDFYLTPEYASRQILDTMRNAVVVVDLQGRITVVNPAAASLLGYSMKQLVGEPLRKILDESESSNKLRMHSGGVLESPMVWRSAKGERIDVLTSSSSVRGRDGAPVGVVYVASDYTERRRTEQKLRESEARYRLLFERNLAGVYRTNTDGLILDCNEAFARIFGYPSREAMLRDRATALYFEEGDREQAIALLREQKSILNFEARMRRKDNSAVWVLENMTLLQGGEGEPAIIEGTIIDITDRKYAQEQIEYQAYHDILTGLPNRLLFSDRVTLALAHARRAARSAAVMFLDLDDFKAVNDSHGHAVGDRLLQALAMRLVGVVRAEDTVARMGGDEFTILLADVSDARAAGTVAQKVLEAVSQPVVIGERELCVHATIGVALYPGDGFDAEMLLRNADGAMYRAKQLGGNNYQYATPPPADVRAALQLRIEHSIERGEFLVHYQPIVDIAAGRIVAAEALMRWNDAARGLITPEEFIPAAEESDLILTLGDWMLRTACRDMKRWHDLGHSALRVSVNLSARQFQQRDLPAVVARALERSGLPASALDVEITESTAMERAELSLVTMRALKQMGVRICIDDFGTGYSSLSYLRRFPIDTVKIDQEFIRDLHSDSNDRAIITAIISMARALGLRVVAEGVETMEQLEFLRAEHCAEMQGFLYSKPLPQAEFERLLHGAVAEVDIPAGGAQYRPS